jgi:hypothetical protein
MTPASSANGRLGLTGLRSAQAMERIMSMNNNVPRDEDNVIRIEDARELRELGLPILPIVDKEFSEPATQLIFEADKARTMFYRAFVDYCKAAKPTKRRFNRIAKALARIIDLSKQAANFTSPDESEVAALQALLTQQMEPFAAYWQETLAHVEEGESVTITISHEMFDGWAIS